MLSEVGSSEGQSHVVEASLLPPRRLEPFATAAGNVRRTF